MIDLRSDTVTRPDAAMRRAMAEAEVGDDAYGEDPTVRRLEEEAAEAVGHEAALFVPTGTMGNEIALGLLAPRGTEVICEARSHVVGFEMGGMAVLNGLLPRTLHAPGGLLDPDEVEAAVMPGGGYRTATGLISVEQSHNMAGGTVYAPEHLDALVAVARRRGLPIHLDGARLFNAAVALGVPAARLAAGFDTVMFCLSKGLGAPVGSLLAGSADLIDEARRSRKRLGGGMRQAGVLAAPGLLALRDGPGRLAEDHAHARRLAEALAGLPGIEVELEAVVTNILIFRVTKAFPGLSGKGDGAVYESAAPSYDAAAEPAEALTRALETRGVRAVAISRQEVRLVTHRDVSAVDVERVVSVLREMATGG